MKKILILSYHFAPLNVIASKRAVGFARYLKSYGFEPTVLTFDWNKTFEEQYCDIEDFDKLIKREETPDFKVVRIPVIRKKRLLDIERKEGTRLYSLWALICRLSGNLDIKPRLISFGLSEKYYLENYINKGDFDVVMGIYSPHFHLRNIWHLHQKLALPYVLDFRDLWNNKYLGQDLLKSKSEKLETRLTSFYWKKWCTHAAFLSTVSGPLAMALNNITGKNTLVFTNGFDAESILEQPKRKESDEFVIAHTGTIYPENQRIDIILDGVKSFQQNYPEANIRLKFIGLKKDKEQVNSLIKKMEQAYSDINMEITGRLPYEEALRIQQQADLLIFPTNPVVPGMVSGKIYEYLISGTPILAAPHDTGAVKQLLTETGSGVCVNTAAEVGEMIDKIYHKDLVFEPDSEAVKQYSRKFQTGRLADELTNNLP